MIQKMKKCQKWKIGQFSKSSKSVNFAPNHVLNSEKIAIDCFNPNPKYEENS